MGKKTGDKSRYYRERRKKHEKRLRMRALRAEAAKHGAKSKDAAGSEG